jgi:hypothetical protein
VDEKREDGSPYSGARARAGAVDDNHHGLRKAGTAPSALRRMLSPCLRVDIY